MLYIAENLKRLRREKSMTQEEVSEILNVSPQSVSKWERGETYPDITLLPTLAILYETSVDALIGMDKITDAQSKNVVYTKVHEYLRQRENERAMAILAETLKTFPNDEGLLSDYAMSLALEGSPENVVKAAALCERVLSGSENGKIHHTTRAALCFIHLKANEQDKALAVARNLPHQRESREVILAEIQKRPATEEIDAYLRFIAIGEEDEQDVVCVDVGMSLVPAIADSAIRERIGALRKEAGAKKFPMVRIRDNGSLSPRRIRIRYYADLLLDESFDDDQAAIASVTAVLEKIALRRT